MIFNPIQWHLALVHLPVIGLPIGLIVFAIARFRAERFWELLALGGLLGCIVASGLAYLTGPPTYEELLRLAPETAEPLTEQIEGHALVARSAFLGMIVLGVLVINQLFGYWQNEPHERPSVWVARGTVGLGVLLCYLLAWSAHLGGSIRHPEIRQPTWRIFPDLPTDAVAVPEVDPPTDANGTPEPNPPADR